MRLPSFRIGIRPFITFRFRIDGNPKVTWFYNQRNGELSHGSKIYQYGYSGFGEGKNNPGLQGVRDVGPIPRGKYLIGAPFHHGHAGPFTMRLTPMPGTNTFGRDLFMIHGDSQLHPGSASNGCIIELPEVRHAIWNSNDHVLEVI